MAAHDHCCQGPRSSPNPLRSQMTAIRDDFHLPSPGCLLRLWNKVFEEPSKRGLATLPWRTPPPHLSKF